jgi:hypothetical protein
MIGTGVGEGAGGADGAALDSPGCGLGMPDSPGAGAGAPDAAGAPASGAFSVCAGAGVGAIAPGCGGVGGGPSGVGDACAGGSGVDGGEVVTCARAPSASVNTNARLPNVAWTRRKQLSLDETTWRPS